MVEDLAGLVLGRAAGLCGRAAGGPVAEQVEWVQHGPEQDHAYGMSL